jgi:uncharacterized protein with PIN domain
MLKEQKVLCKKTMAFCDKCGKEIFPSENVFNGSKITKMDKLINNEMFLYFCNYCLIEYWLDDIYPNFKEV